MSSIWRLVPQIAASGSAQMALDSWLLDQHYQANRSDRLDLDFSVLRFYRWSPAAISLGYHQREIPDRWHGLAIAQGLDLVRRPSGGRAVLHKGDLTYAVITSTNGKRRETYKYICEFLIQGFADLGIQLQYGKAGRGYMHNPNCFATATSADLVTSNGQKLIGSAQLYRHNSVLQHGSIAIQPDYDLLQQIFGIETPVVGLAELLNPGESPTDDRKFVEEKLIDLAIAALTQAAEKHFGAQFWDFPIDTLPEL
ncbi:MAG: lipoate--protein ligase family protein [Pseudanabaena sp. SU_2_4]|nr:lipoate--protein ligase family protein [Pseudanabaena sp. SU_2_4]NKB17037.1 lipoate--protein ligase family protein [Pseudanabaena sp. CRU_2_10]